MIEHENIIYIRDFSELGGVETFTYEMVKKYHDRDIAVVYKMGHINQIKRIKKYCNAYRHTNQKIKCRVAIINYDTSIIDYIDKDAEIYQVIHGDYENAAYTWKPPTHPRIKEYIGVTKHIRDSFKRITGLENVSYSYNPLTIETDERIVLLSATRLSKIKGKDRMIKLAEALDRAGVKYVWYVFTNDTNAIDSKNVIYLKPRLDIGYWFDSADYIVQLSDTEACSYTINEALYRNKPVIVTPLPYLNEIGVKDNVNAYIMEFDCSNVDDIVNKITNIPKFEFKKLEDRYDDILVESKSHYKEDLEMQVKVKALFNFKDLEAGADRKKDSEFICTYERAQFLAEKKAVAILEEIKEPKKKNNDSKPKAKKTTNTKKTSKK